ncbi:hypothetical protein [Micromonospora sp. DT62]|uniref:hypothetical protein n=1 Tax=Micromonospora sp. DT62 TaxID=3416521 RepID=UPI003CF2978F
MTQINPSRPPDGATGTAQQTREEASRVGHQAAQAGGNVAHTAAEKGGHVAHAAAEKGGHIAHAAAEKGGHVAHAAAEQGGHVASEARRQARNLTGEAGTQLRDQARAQQHRAADGLRGIGRELSSMAERSEDSGMAAQAVRRAADAAQQAAGWLDEREPGAVLHDVRSYARRHPGTFLAGAALAGMLVGRLTRNLTASGDGARGEGQPSMPPTAAPTGPGTAPTGPTAASTTAGPQPYERTAEAPYLPEEAYTGTARVRNASPSGRQGPDIPGGVAP